jgi:hypothetical protein
LGVRAVQGGKVAGVVDDPQVTVDGRVLRDIADAVAQFGGARRMAQHRDRPRGDDLGAHDGPHQGGLPAARGAQQSGDGARPNLYREIAHGVVVTAGDLQMVDADRRFAVPARKFIVR